MPLVDVAAYILSLTLTTLIIFAAGNPLEEPNFWCNSSGTGVPGVLPENAGKIYDCEMWLEEDNMDELKVRGYIYFLFRTQTWLRQ